MDSLVLARSSSTPSVRRGAGVAPVRVVVAGASGYIGAELIRLLLRHPRVELAGVTSGRLAGERLDRSFPHLRGLTSLTFHDLDPEWLADVADVALLALPHMESQRAVPVLRRRGRRTVDLSADYRLRDANDYVTWYKTTHEDAQGLAEAVYGLPELHRKAIAGAALVAVPGCYPAGAILATAPLLKAGLARADGIVIDGKSGATGAGAQGRKIDPMYLYTEANENVQAYGIGFHRHTPEMEQEMTALCGEAVRVSFTPHLLPLNRGLFTTASVPLTRAVTTADLVAVYRAFYAGEPFVRVADEGTRPTTRAVAGSNFCDVAVVADSRTQRATCLSAIDNLGKGGAANGVQNLNAMMGWDERTGLEASPVYP
jgi:N-acetyl-gamma-glutamyl-phosphate reductase